MGTWSPYIILTCLCLTSPCQSSSSTLRKFAGDDAVLQCGSNNTFPRWYGPDSIKISLIFDNGTEYTDKKQRESYCENKRDLCFAGLRISDAGVYKCQAEKHSHNITLNVHEREMFTNLSKLAGTDVKLNCNLNVSLPYWFGPEFPQIPLVHATMTVFNPNTKLVKEHRLYFCENRRDLCIKNLKTYDEGEYKCIWLGIGTHTTALSVHKQNTTSEQTQKMGDNVILRCDFKGTYPTWYGPEHPSCPLVQRGSIDRNTNPIKEGRWSYDKNKRDLFIESLEKTDFGEYVCMMPGLGNHTINLRLDSEHVTIISVIVIVALLVNGCILIFVLWKIIKNIKHRWRTIAEKMKLKTEENAHNMIPPADNQERQRGKNYNTQDEEDETIKKLFADNQETQREENETLFTRKSCIAANQGQVQRIVSKLEQLKEQNV